MIGIKAFSGILFVLLFVSMVQSSPLVQRSTLKDTSPFRALSLPATDWTHYHNYTEIATILLALNETYPDVADVFSIGQSWQNRSIYCVRLTNETDHRTKPEVLFVGCHHARETISAELTLYFVVYAASNFGTNATITELLNGCEIYVVVALNVDGVELFKANDRQRKNARPTDDDGDGLIDEDPPEDLNGDGLIEDLLNVTDPQNPEYIRTEGINNDGDLNNGEDWIGGVDLNRNYDYKWENGNPRPSSEIYRGPAPFSEPETQAIRNLTLQHNFTYAISFHSGAEMILYPWGWTSLPTPDEARFVQISKDLSRLTGGTEYFQAHGLYPTYGDWADWMYGNRSVLALTCEIFQNGSFIFDTPGPYPNTVWEGWYRYFFNPFPAAIESTILRWNPVFYYIAGRAIADAAPKNIAVEDVSTGKAAEENYLINFNVSVRNTGLFPATFNVSLYADATEIARQEITLSNGSSATVSFSWNTSGFGREQGYAITGYAWPIPDEVYLGDNTFFAGYLRVVPGDIDGNFIVDILDLTIVATAYSSIPSDPNWDPRADINEDHLIDIFDLVTVALHFGQTGP